MLAFLLAAFDETPTKTVQAFLDAFNARDAAAMSRRIVGQKPGKFPFPTDDFPTFEYKFGEEKIVGDTATVSVDLKMTVKTRSGVQNSHEDVPLAKVGEDWQIVPASELRGDPNHMVPLLALLVTDNSVFTMARSAAKKTACLSNVKQIALATLLYMNDHDDHLPKDASRFRATIMPYVKNSEIFHCPEDKPGAVSYFLDPRIAGMDATHIASPAQTAMVIEGAKNHAIFRHGGMAAVGYLDGHAKMLKADQVLKARTVKLN